MKREEEDDGVGNPYTGKKLFGESCGKVAVTEATLNEESGTIEYHAPVPEGAAQVNAIVYGLKRSARSPAKWPSESIGTP